MTNTFLKLNKNLELGNKFFLIGVFFLPSAIPIGVIFLLISIVISFRNQNYSFIKDIWDKFFLVCIILILLSTLNTCLLNIPNELKDFNKSIIFLNLFNWIPIIIVYFGFKNFLINREQKILFEKYFIAGTIPVLLSCILQKFFNLHGPFETLFGLITWFNKQLNGPITGLFNNPNYLGLWLNLCLPFSLVRLKYENNFRNKIFLLCINSLIIYFILETHSRNALIGLVITFLILFSLKKVLIFCFFSILGFLGIIYLIPILLDIKTINLLDFTNNNALEKFKYFDPNLNYPRILIWKQTIALILERPFWGWGGATFANVYLQKYNFLLPYKFIIYQHSHNLILELAYNFGIPLSALYTFNVFAVFTISLKRVFSFKYDFSLYDSKPWIAAFGLFLFTQLNDVTYYDGKISLISCILFVGLKNFINEIQYSAKATNQVSK